MACQCAIASFRRRPFFSAIHEGHNWGAGGNAPRNNLYDAGRADYLTHARARTAARHGRWRPVNAPCGRWRPRAGEARPRRRAYTEGERMPRRRKPSPLYHPMSGDDSLRGETYEQRRYNARVRYRARINFGRDLPAVRRRVINHPRRWRRADLSGGAHELAT